MDKVYLRSPVDTVEEVDATATALTPLMAAGYHQVPAPGPGTIPPPGMVLMQSPTGDIQEVPAPSPQLSSLMVAGWHEVPAKPEQASGGTR